MIEVKCKRCGISSGDLDPKTYGDWVAHHEPRCSPAATVVRVLALLDKEDPGVDIQVSDQEDGYWEAIGLLRRVVEGEYL